MAQLGALANAGSAGLLKREASEEREISDRNVGRAARHGSTPKAGLTLSERGRVRVKVDMSCCGCGLSCVKRRRELSAELWRAFCCLVCVTSVVPPDSLSAFPLFAYLTSFTRVSRSKP